MKALNLFKTKTARTFAIMATALFLLPGCGNSDKANPETLSKPEVPKMDIHTAVILGDINTINTHIEAGTDLNNIEPMGGSTALITSVVLGKTDIATALIEAGADINISNNDGSSPLYCAAFFGRDELVKILLDKGADKNIRNNFGSTALEAVSAPFDAVKGIYDQMGKDLGPIGLNLDYDELRRVRPLIAEMLSNN